VPIFRLTHQHVFPDPSFAEDEPNGLLAVGGDLSPNRLLVAYRHGIFPWYSAGQPILWWSPDPRMVLYPGELHVPKSLHRTLNQCVFTLTLDRAFAQVIHACGQAPRPDQDGTWITPDMEAAYTRLHQLGHAHSAEAWLGDELAGGVYGLALGRFFSAESMFYRAPNASKAALVHLVRQLAAWGFPLIDVQMHTPNTDRFGAREIPRKRYLRELARAAARPGLPGPWQFDPPPVGPRQP
jgi:leucyl/phenylalanyl-tRNA---protein transferase